MGVAFAIRRGFVARLPPGNYLLTILPLSRADEARLQRIQSSIIGFRAEPAQVALRVGECFPLSGLKVVAVDALGQPVNARLGRAPLGGFEIAPIADTTVVRLSGADLEALAPGQTQIALRPILTTRSGEQPKLTVEIAVTH